jgi:hypothetical protein
MEEANKQAYLEECSQWLKWWRQPTLQLPSIESTAETCKVWRADFSPEDQANIKWFQETILDQLPFHVGHIQFSDAQYGGRDEPSFWSNLKVYRTVREYGERTDVEYPVRSLLTGHVVPMYELLNVKKKTVIMSEAAKQAVLMGVHGPNSKSSLTALEQGDGPELFKSIGGYWGEVSDKERRMQRVLDAHGLKELGYEERKDPNGVRGLYPTEELLRRMEPLVTSPRPKANRTRKHFAVKRKAYDNNGSYKESRPRLADLPLGESDAEEVFDEK